MIPSSAGHHWTHIRCQEGVRQSGTITVTPLLPCSSVPLLPCSFFLSVPLLPRQVIEEARGEASEYRYLFSQPIPLKVFSHTPTHPYCMPVYICVCPVSCPHASCWWTGCLRTCTSSLCTVPCARLAAASSSAHTEPKVLSCT